MNRSTEQAAYLFDIDGVITSPKTKRLEQPGILNELNRRLAQGHLVGFNTGRSLEFGKHMVVDHLQTMVSPDVMHGLVLVGEKGAAWTIYERDGKVSNERDPETSIPDDFYHRIEHIANSPVFSEVMFMDHSKHTMATVEMHSPEDLNRLTSDDFKRRQKLFAQKVSNELQVWGLDEALRVDQTRIATDIENVHVGKALGAERYVRELAVLGFSPQRFICFGDSPSDYEMHEALTRYGRKSQFVYVGEPHDLRDKDLSKVIFTQNHLDIGTLEYLSVENI
jgi:hydroxymethylpyrimidine pyrophosphatase-like HAD family hydrolase